MRAGQGDNVCICIVCDLMRFPLPVAVLERTETDWRLLEMDCLQTAAKSNR
jgi:hypothetical protein